MKGSLTRLSAELGRQGDALLTVQASLTASSEDTARAAQQVHDSLNGVSASLNGNIARAQNLEAAVLGDGGVKHGVQALHDLLAEVRDVLVDARLADGMQTKLETLACDVAAGREVAHESLCVLRNLHADIGRLYESHIEFRRAATRAERDDFGVARMIDDMARSTQNIREATRGLRNAVTGGEALRAAVGELSGKLAAVPAATTAYVARRAPRPASGHASWAKPATHTRAEESRHAASRVEENATHERSGHRAKGSVRARELKAKVGSVIVRSKQGPPPGGERKGSDGGMRRRSQRLMGRAGARGRRMADA
ncbi:hypothetical protein O9K51_09858 [Purpureocillium lavendulum]|uniref:Uncharacterized protein n=1 Tax=Purpureocillium lavendulum TaxID=1247861 RepID=A0AB34FGV4_9HYPO|nr:hypothetical protein O9K51_09858 [Purpureocillium lavendulum]